MDAFGEGSTLFCFQFSRKGLVSQIFWKTHQERWKYTNLGAGLQVTGLKEESRSHVGKLRDHKTNHFHCAASQYPLSELD